AGWRWWGGGDMVHVSLTGEEHNNKNTQTELGYSKGRSCGRTKAASIVTGVLAPSSVEQRVQELTSPMLAGGAHTLAFPVASEAPTTAAPSLSHWQ
ncbi:hypothetical protein NFI96_022547, partial [Prochilodus magdalenae]